MHEMEMPYDAMLAKADEAFNKNGWHDTNELFGVHVDNLDKVPTSEWLILLMHVLMMEYACYCTAGLQLFICESDSLAHVIFDAVIQIYERHLLATSLENAMGIEGVPPGTQAPPPCISCEW